VVKVRPGSPVKVAVEAPPPARITKSD